MKYPKIKRDNIDFTSDTEVCNIGYTEGKLKSGRPYRLEVFSSHNVITATFFISIIDLENKSEQDIKNILVENNLINIIQDKIYITEIEDINNNTFISINVPVEEDKELINEYLVKIKDYELD